MVSYFVGGALGSTLGAWAWGVFAWSGVCFVGLAFSALGLATTFVKAKAPVRAPVPVR